MRWNYILIRTSEISLKSGFVRHSMEKKLMKNIRKGLEICGAKGKVGNIKGRIIIETEDIEKTNSILKHVFGIVSFSPCIRMKLSELYNFIEENATELINGKTFAVRTNRVGNHSFSSQDLARDLGEILVKKTKKKVDLKYPDSEVFVEVRYDEAYVYTEKIQSPGGIPLGIQGRAICFVDNKDGIVAAWFMMKRGCKLIICHTHDIDANVLDKWAYGIKLEKIEVKSIEETKEISEEKNMILALSDRLQKTSLKNLRKRIEDIGCQVLLPIITFTDDEIEEKFEELTR